MHDTRVAARRFRALLRGLESRLNPVLATQLEFELRAIGRTLAPLRDADVRRASVAGTLRGLLRSDPVFALQCRDFVASFLASLDGARLQERRDLRSALRSDSWAGRLERIRRFLRDEALVLPGRESLAETLAPEIERRWRRLHRRMQGNPQSIRRLHRLRIGAREVRYLIEECVPAPERNGLASLELARRVQNALGDLHDLVQLRAWADTADVASALREVWLVQADGDEQALRKRVRALARGFRTVKTAGPFPASPGLPPEPVPTVVAPVRETG